MLLLRLEEGMLGEGDAPVEGGARDGQVPQRLLQFRQDLVLAVRWLDELGVGLDVGEELLLVLGHAEEVALFRHLRQRHAARRILVVAHLGLVLRDKRLLAHVVPPLVRVQVDVPLLDRTHKQGLGTLLVLVHGRADVKVVGDVEALVELLEGVGVLVADLDGLHAQPLCRLRDLLPMLVGPREVEHLPAVHPVPPCKNV
mmetsp:Transcript_54949/g.112205  ORF Transcript_54949/g.112205 Transcript_54949/m.112205 type:complete len:200 (-) Transcript_54949:840-1439(-)